MALSNPGAPVRPEELRVGERFTTERHGLRRIAWEVVRIEDETLVYRIVGGACESRVPFRDFLPLFRVGNFYPDDPNNL